MANFHRTLPRISEQRLRVLWSLIKATSDDDCWEWQGRTCGGYGVFDVGKYEYKSHRIVYQQYHPRFNQSLCVLHKCDNPGCCNPSHLFTGTQGDNIRDMFRKGRANRPKGSDHHWSKHPECLPHGTRHWSNVHPEKVARGERNGLAKLTDDKVAVIRNKYKRGWYTMQDLADIYDVTKQAIYAVIHRRTWKHVK